jgi:hypothetical protein
MDAAAWIALAGVLATILLNVGGYLIAWGVVKGTVTSLAARVTSLEGEMKAVGELKLDVARLETRLDALIEHVRDLAASIRWMREPAEGRYARSLPPIG